MKSNKLLVFPILALLLVTLACGRTTSPAPVASTEQPVAAQPQMTDAPVETGGPCDNILFPFVTGYQWVYATKTDDTSTPEPSSQLGLTVDKVEGSVATINALDVATAVVSQTTVQCQDGAILNYPALTQKMLLGNAMTSDFTLEYVSGVFAPAEAAFTDNNWQVQWEADYIANGTVAVNADGDAMDIILQDSPVHITWQTAGAGDAAFESITVPAGTFDRALKTSRKVTMDISFSMDGFSVTGKLTLDTTQWYEPHVGLLRSQIDSAEIKYMGMSFPIVVNGIVELVEFRP